MQNINFSYDLALIQAQILEKLPQKPYCTDDLGYLVVRPKEIAIQKRYIQHNPPCFTSFLVFDLDTELGAVAWHDADLPLPTWTTQNPDNGHAHIAYALKTPVVTTEQGSNRAIDYLAKIQAGMARKLGADTGYSGLITKNPLHNHWRTTVWNTKPYELGELADRVELAPLTPKERELGLGRNCTLFDTVRKWAYIAIREHRGGRYDDWYARVLATVQAENMAFLEPLPYSEIKATAKSIAVYCWKNDGHCYNEFIYRQRLKGAIGGKKSKRPPMVDSERTLQPWIELGISRRTYYRDLNDNHSQK
ncbi:replication initiation protein [Moraxella catarrhalis]|jgi:hypothetical protein|uniref:Replicase n=2 Tax=Moraxella catarrhalis TaxID=480 RepID=Q6YA35_MORCA|nr:replication initiation protein [Moraxella catarrhalis]AAO38173.1 replicase [Moraxella catarrhalis]AAR88169.1 putative replicase [Expression vector pEMCJH04]OAV10729.1 Replication protein [Moraxella catarrhalis]